VCALGLGDTGQEGRLLSPVLDEVLSHAPIPMVVVRRARNQGTRLPAAFSRALVPVTGGRSSRAAQEIACSISQSLGTELVFTHVVDRPDSRMGGLGDLLSMRRAGASASAADLDTAERIVQDAIQRAAEYGVSPRTDVRTGSPAGSVMVSAAGDNGVDLVILGASLRHVEGRPFLGHAVEHVLETVDATVVVVLLAADPQSAQ
jgi:nucleotide-binding universal stress UspA family protein